MRFATLIPLLTLGAAPLPVSAMLECRLTHDQAIAALSRLPVLSHEDRPGEDEYRHSRKFDPAHLTAFGFPVRGTNTLEVDAISHETIVITTGLDAPYAAVRAAALASWGKSACIVTEGLADECGMGRRDQDGWAIYFELGNLNGRPVLSCLYTRPPD